MHVDGRPVDQRNAIVLAVRIGFNSTPAQASLRVQNLTLGTKRPRFVPAAGGSEAWQQLRERLDEAEQRARDAWNSIEPPR